MLPELEPAYAAGIPAAFWHCAAAANSARAMAVAHCAAIAQRRHRLWVPSVARHHWLPLVFDATLPIQKISSRRGSPPRATSRCRRGCEPLGIRPATRSCPAELGRAISGWSVGQRVSRRLQRVRSPSTGLRSPNSPATCLSTVVPAPGCITPPMVQAVCMYATRASLRVPRLLCMPARHP